MGIINVINGRENWLSRMNPDPIGHPSGSVNWIGEGQELIFIGSYRGCGLYDGQGYKMVELPNESCNESNYRYRPAITFADVLGDPRPEIIHIWQGVVTVYTQDTLPPNPDCIYAPVHQGIVSWPPRQRETAKMTTVAEVWRISQPTENTDGKTGPWSRK